MNSCSLPSKILMLELQLTISRWLKEEVMQRAGIDTEVIKPHSTRSASVSAAKEGECLCLTFSRLPSQHFRYMYLHPPDIGNLLPLPYSALNYTCMLSYIKWIRVGDLTSILCGIRILPVARRIILYDSVFPTLTMVRPSLYTVITLFPFFSLDRIDWLENTNSDFWLQGIIIIVIVIVITIIGLDWFEHYLKSSQKVSQCDYRMSGLAICTEHALRSYSEVAVNWANWANYTVTLQLVEFQSHITS